MSTREAFLEAIIKNPEDDAPRLIFADWLEEHGEPERADFIRVQCELAKIPHDHSIDTAGPDKPFFVCKYCLLTKREQELLSGLHYGLHSEETRWRNWAAWAGKLILRITGETVPIFRRGFVAEITCTVGDWIDYRDAILKATPLEKVNFVPDNIYAFAVTAIKGLNRGQTFLIPYALGTLRLSFDGKSQGFLEPQGVISYPARQSSRARIFSGRGSTVRINNGPSLRFSDWQITDRNDE